MNYYNTSKKRLYKTQRGQKIDQIYICFLKMHPLSINIDIMIIFASSYFIFTEVYTVAYSLYVILILRTEIDSTSYLKMTHGKNLFQT